jgi:methyltransferase-like protein
MGEYLAAASTPCYFHEFAARAKAHGLAFLSEARIGNSLPEELHPDLDRKIRAHAGDDPIAFEQYVDLFLGRQFRRSVLVGAERAARISRTLPVTRLAGLHIATSLELDLEASSHGKVVFKNSDGRTHTETDPDVCRALELLAAISPRTLTPEAICVDAVPAGIHDRAPREARVVEALLAMVKADFGTVSTCAVRAGEATAPTPQAWQIARRDAGLRRPWTTNLGHRVVALDEATCWLLTKLDDSTDSADLAKQLIDAVEIGEIARSSVVPADRPALPMAEAADIINRLIEFCAKNALLEPRSPDDVCQS